MQAGMILPFTGYQILNGDSNEYSGTVINMDGGLVGDFTIAEVANYEELAIAA